MSNASSPCPKCGQPFDPSRATYDNNGNLQCDACAVRGQIAIGDARAGNSLYGAAGGLLLAGIVSIFCSNPFGIFSLITLISGAGWLVTVSGNPSYREMLGSRYTSALVMTTIGTGLAALATLAVALRMMGFVLSL